MPTSRLSTFPTTISGLGSAVAFTPTITQIGNTFTFNSCFFVKLPGLLVVSINAIPGSTVSQTLTVTLPGGSSTGYSGTVFPAGFYNVISTGANIALNVSTATQVSSVGAIALTASTAFGIFLSVPIVS